MTILRNRALISAGLYALLLFASCKKDADTSTPQSLETGIITTPQGNDNTPLQISLYIKFLWRDSRGNIMINDAYAQKISAAEKAALGYVATFIGSDCDWDGPYSDKMDNLKCLVLTALDLGYQCSDQHLGFLRQWFREDAAALKKLENCPTVPYTATSQTTFDEITITTKGDEILVSYKVNGINLREQQTWSLSSTDHFEFDHNSIKLVKQEKSEVKREHLEVGE